MGTCNLASVCSSPDRLEASVTWRFSSPDMLARRSSTVGCRPGVRYGHDLPVAPRVVTIAAEAPGATYFIVKPDRGQLTELGRLADARELLPTLDSTFPLERAVDAFERVAERSKRGKVVLDVAGA
jgi:NADPH:quinone reductase-like Zn-dependent oxidoreductase